MVWLPVFFAEVPVLIETPRSVATCDLMHPETRRQRPADFETRLRFGMALTRLAVKDPTVHLLTVEVQNLLKPCSVYRNDPALMKRFWRSWPGREPCAPVPSL